MTSESSESKVSSSRRKDILEQNGNTNSSGTITSTKKYRKEVDESLRTWIKLLVSSTNNALASLEHTTNVTSTNFVSRLTPIARQLRYAAGKVAQGYSNRQFYGPPIIVGSALLVGSIASLRRGKMVGGFAGILTAGGLYTNIYGFDASKV